jgi:uncharacterized protein (TIGR00255 family)
MTGFGGAEGGDEHALSWRWELRSVNGKGLDIKFRTPTGAEAIETDARRQAKPLGRGSVSANLRVERATDASGYVINDDSLAAAAAAIAHIRTVIDCDKPRPEAILGLRGILKAPNQETGFTEDDVRELTAGFGEALGALLQSRRAEGERIAAVLRERVAVMQKLTAGLRQDTADTREQMASRLETQLGELLSQHVSADRLAQEAALLAIRADVREELDRLEVHLASFAELLDQGGVPGRRLEFLTQELMREASTLTAKLHSAELKGRGLDLKELVDSLREQVLNIA